MKQRVISALIMVPLLIVVYLSDYVLMGACFIVSIFALREFYKAFEKSAAMGGYGQEAELTDEAIVEAGELLALDSADSGSSVEKEAPDMPMGPETLEEENVEAEGLSVSVGLFNGPVRPVYWVGYLGTALLYVMILLYDPRFNDPRFIFLTLWVFLMIVLSFCATFRPPGRRLADSVVTIFGLFYVSVLLLIVFMAGFGNAWIDNIGNNIPIFSGSWFAHWDYGFRNPLWFALIAAYGTDIFAYFTGFLIGRHRLAPNISPNKTVEGAIGGVIGSTLLCWLYGHFLMTELPSIHSIVIGVVGGVVAQLGDLTASFMKRRLGIKDFGTLIPGHGGILDRLDSLLFTAPFVFFYMNIGGYIVVILGAVGTVN